MRHERGDTRRGELEHPANVARRDEVPRRPQHVRAQDPPFVDLPFDLGVGDVSGALSQRPLRAGVVLCLHSAKRPHHFARARRTSRRQELARQSPATDVFVRHVSRNRSRSLCVVKSPPLSPTTPFSTMSLSRRTIARAGVLAFGTLALAACHDSTAPLNVTPDQLQSIGESIATEIEGGITQLTAQDVMSTNGGAPTFARVPRPVATMFRGLSLNRVASSASAVAQCGVASQSPPVDSDGDQVPDNFSVTFSLPACHYQDLTDTYDITGVLSISDPQP